MENRRIRKPWIILGLFLLLYFPVYAASTIPVAVFHMDKQTYGTIDTITVKLDHDWKYHNGDNKAWAQNDYDDSSWDTLAPLLSSDSAKKQFGGIGWFRIHLRVDSIYHNKIFYLKMQQFGASDLYLNGRRIHRFGKVGKNDQSETSFNPVADIYLIHLSNQTDQTIAVRYSAWKAIDLVKSGYRIPLGYRITLKSPSAIGEAITKTRGAVVWTIFLFGMFLALAFIHLLLFLYYKKLKSNLYYSIMTFLFSLFWLMGYLKVSVHDPVFLQEFLHYSIFTYPVLFLSMLLLLYALFRMKLSKFFWVNVAVGGLTELFLLTSFDTVAFIGVIASVLLPSVDIIRIIISAIRKKKDGAWIIGTGFLIFAVDILLLFLLIFILAISQTHSINFTTKSPVVIFLLIVWILSIPVSMSVYLAREFSHVNKDLKMRLDEVHELSRKTIEQEKEKQQMIQGQKEELEIQVAARTKEVVEQKVRIEEINKNITDSINYAKKIQEAILPDRSFIREHLAESFIVFIPRDIVSGDFYWFTNLPDGSVVLAAADCTGHGVPGAFMSMIGKALLDEIVNEMGLHEPDKILAQLHESVQAALKQDDSDSESRDGMDIVLCRIHKNERKLVYSGAMRPLWIVRKNGELEEIKATKQAIGGRDITQRTAFAAHEIVLEEGDTVYMSSDGYADQFGGADGKKMKAKNLKILLQKIAPLSVEEQRKELIEKFQTWKEGQEQVDDVLIIGVRM